MKSRVRNHSRVGHGQRTGGAEERGRLAGRCMGSVSTLALFHDQTEACRDLYLNCQVWHRSIEHFNCLEYYLQICMAVRFVSLYNSDITLWRGKIAAGSNSVKFIHHSSVICHTTGPQPPPKRFLHLMRSFFKAIIVTSVKSLGHSPVSYMVFINYSVDFAATDTLDNFVADIYTTAIGMYTSFLHDLLLSARSLARSLYILVV
jgi:hypothetical protein